MPEEAQDAAPVATEALPGELAVDAHFEWLGHWVVWTWPRARFQGTLFLSTRYFLGVPDIAGSFKTIFVSTYIYIYIYIYMCTLKRS